MEIDHIFIFTDNKGIEGEDLIKFGLTEGSSRIHKGQGTTNRKFYFKNFFLELLWVIDEKEVHQSPAKETGLWQRANFKKNGASRFGLCLLNTTETDELFKGGQRYEPNYFPNGMSIDILSNSDNPKLPWTFRLPIREGKKVLREPTNHQNQIRKLTKAEFGVPKLSTESDYIKFFNTEESIIFKETSISKLVLEFDFGRQEKIHNFVGLDMIIKY